MRRKGLPQLGGWLSLPMLALVLAHFVWSTGRAIASEGYDLWPLSVNAAALLRDNGLRAGLILLALLAAGWWPLRAWGGHAERWTWIARLWSFLMVAPVWAIAGLRFNRFTEAELWRSSVQWGSVSFPAALGSAKVWAVNLGISVAALGVGWLVLRGWKLLLPSLATYRAPRWWRLGAVIASLVLPLAALLPTSFAGPQPTGGDVILISLDAFRADRLAVYGGSGITPHLDRFALDATVYENATCQEPWTLTSHMSMLSGLYPDVHGLDFGRSLPGAIWTLPELMRDAGWKTYGSVYDCLFLDGRFGYGKGFDHYEVSQQPALPRAQAFAKRILDSGPSFGFLHFYDPHSDRQQLPYEASPIYLQRHAAGAADKFDGWSGTGGASETLHEVNEGRWTLNDAQRDALEELYDAGVAETDAAVGVFLDALRAAGRYDDALIIIVADHGEALGEMGRSRPHYMHEELIESTLHIPLLIKYPGRAPARVKGLAETVDLLPTVCDLMEIDPPVVMQGRSLLATGDASLAGREFSIARSGEEYAITALDGQRLRYRWSEATGVQFEGSEAVDDSLGDRAVEVIARFHRSNAALAQRFGGGAVRLSEADEALLRSLGYMQ
jgi:Sulfatase